MIRVALIGNMNNNFFAIARHLRDFGYDAHLFYRAAVNHFLPENDTWTDDYKTYCHEVDWLKNGVCFIDEQSICKDLAGFDFYIGQGDEAAAAYRAGVNMDVYYPYGSDVYKYAQLPQEFLLRHKVLLYLKLKNCEKTRSILEKGTPAKSMRGVISNAKHVLFEYTNKDFENKLRLLKCKGQVENVPMPFIYPEAPQQMIKENRDCKWQDVINNARKKYDLLLLYHGRQEWKTKFNEFTQKNTHHLIIGFANYVKQARKKACLVMLEYGTDVEYSKELVESLGITDHVIWLPKMQRKEIMRLISMVDVCSGEFVRSYLTFGTVVESMLLGKPVIHYREDKLYEEFYPKLYPLLNAREPDEITNAISFAADNPDTLRLMGVEASNWIKQYFIDRPLQRLKELIEGRSHKKDSIVRGRSVEKPTSISEMTGKG